MDMYRHGSTRRIQCLHRENTPWHQQHHFRPGGALINFDADDGTTDFTGLGDNRDAHAHRDLKNSSTPEPSVSGERSDATKREFFLQNS